MLMPSETEMVVNSRGVPPASAIPALAASTWKSWGHVAGRLFALHADDSNHRPGERLVVEPHRSHEGAVGRPIETIGRHAGSPLLHAQVSLQVVPANAGTHNRRRRLRRLAYCSARDDGRVLETARRPIFGSIPVAA